MFQSNTYRIFILDRLNIEKRALLEARCLAFNIRRDSLAKALSSFTLEIVPGGIKNGDILVLHDSFGTILFNGVINRIDNNIVECNQMESLFNDLWLYRISDQVTTEETVAKILSDDFVHNNDPIIKDTFDVFELATISGTVNNLPTKEFDYTIDFEQFIYNLFDRFFIRFHFEIPFAEENPKINIGVKDMPVIKIANNNNVTRNISPLTEVFETNKLVIYSSEGVYRETWFTSENGITDNPEELTRLTKLKTNIVFSDDDISIIKAQNIRNEIYNHKIEMTMVLNNKLYNFFDFELGQEFSIWYNKRYFNTILTGYELNMNEGGTLDEVKLIFGKVRTRLENKWQLLLNE